MIPHDYVLAQICGEIDDALKAGDEAFQRYRTEKAPILRRAHMEYFLQHKKKAEELMHRLVEIRSE